MPDTNTPPTDSTVDQYPTLPSLPGANEITTLAALGSGGKFWVQTKGPDGSIQRQLYEIDSKLQPHATGSAQDISGPNANNPSATLAGNRAAVAGDYTANGVRYQFQRDPQGNIDYSAPPIPIGGSVEDTKKLIQANLDKIVSEGGLTSAQRDDILAKTGAQVQQIGAQTKLTTSQANLTDVQTEAARQQLIGQHNTVLSQIASGPGGLAYKQKLMDAANNYYLNQYNDVVNKAAALNNYNQQLVSQGNTRANMAGGILQNLAQSATQLSKFAPAAGNFLADLINNGPAMVGAYGGAPVSLQDPTKLWATGASGLDASTVQGMPSSSATPPPPAGTPPPPLAPQINTGVGAQPSVNISSIANGGFGPGSSGVAGGPGDFQPHIASTITPQPTSPLPPAAASNMPVFSPPSEVPPPDGQIHNPTMGQVISGIGSNLTNSPGPILQNFSQYVKANQNNNPDNSIPGASGYYNPTNYAPAQGQWTNPFYGLDTSSYADAVRTAMNGAPNSAIAGLPTNGVQSNLSPWVFSFGNNNGLVPQPGPPPAPLHYAHGGTVPGVPGQAVPIIAHGGERVIPNKLAPTDRVLPEHMQQIRQQIAAGKSPLQAILNVHAINGGDPQILLNHKKGNK